MPAKPNAAAPPLADVRITGGRMGPIQRMVRERMLPYQWEALNDRIEGATKSYCIRNLRATAGEIDAPHGGYVFQDSDVAKWLEAAAYALSLAPDDALEGRCDEVIALMASAQAEDGYLNTYYQLTDLSKRYTNLRDNHELYCAGHLLEAAVAYYEATGKDSLLRVVQRMLENIRAHIGPQEGKLHGYPGHEEIELALIRLYTLTGDPAALDMAAYFINARGQSPGFFLEELERRGEKPHPLFDERYFQSHQPVRDQETMEGHSVRALYLLSGMIDVARETGDAALLDAAKRLFDNTTQKRMYITGAIGSTHHGEAFTFDYDLPPDTAYAETCASIALIFAAARLMRLEVDGRYADVIERALYNTCLAGMALDGSRFFYVNPLEVVPEASRRDPGKRHVLSERPPWYGCACCPPNLARLLLSLGAYQYSVADRDVYAQLYFEGDATLTVGGERIPFRMETAYPDEGTVRIRTGKGDYALHLHIPAWCGRFTLTRAGRPISVAPIDGYATLAGPFADEEIVLAMEMPAQRNYAHPLVRDAAGCTALSRGPVLYCLEAVDNGDNLHLLRLPRSAQVTAQPMPDLLGGVSVLRAQGCRESAEGTALYAATPPSCEEAAPLTFIPYAAWANRGENEMRVWVRES